MMLAPSRSSISVAEQIAGFSPGTLLWRAARSAGRDDAFVTPEGRIGYAAFAQRLLDATSAPYAGGINGPVPTDGIEVSSLLASCDALARGQALLHDPTRPSMSLRGGSRPPSGATHDRTVDAAPFSSPALVHARTGGTDLVWSSEAVCYGWGMCAPPAGTVGVMTSSAGTLRSWSSVFGLLLARGKLLLPGNFGDSTWWTMMAEESVQDLHVDLPQALTILAQPTAPALPALRRLRVWHADTVPLAVLRGLRAIAPHAVIGRVLVGANGPLSLANLDELEHNGPDWLGWLAMGLRCSVDDDHRLLVLESLYLPVAASHPRTSLQGPQPHRDTGLRVDTRGSAQERHWRLITKDFS